MFKVDVERKMAIELAELKVVMAINVSIRKHSAHWSNCSSNFTKFIYKNNFHVSELFCRTSSVHSRADRKILSVHIVFDSMYVRLTAQYLFSFSNHKGYSILVVSFLWSIQVMKFFLFGKVRCLWYCNASQ